MRIGIIGGGQLGMMMAEVAIKMNHKITSLDPNPFASITHFSSIHYSTSFDDKNALQAIFDTCDVITYEFESVSKETLSPFVTKIPQGLKALEISQNRYQEKTYATKLGIPTPLYWLVDKQTPFLGKGILKSLTGGYDGKGQVLIENEKNWLDSLHHNAIFEQFIDFDYEIAIIAARDQYGDIVFYPTVQNTHKSGILHISCIMDEVSKTITTSAQEYTRRLLEDLQYVGTLAVEYFVCGEVVLFNEFAPRPHNAGHFSIDACRISQFENHIRTILGEKVVACKWYEYAMMLNVLGQDDQYLDKAIAHNIGIIHDYKKTEKLCNRKMGHITITGDKQDIKKKLALLIGDNAYE